MDGSIGLGDGASDLDRTRGRAAATVAEVGAALADASRQSTASTGTWRRLSTILKVLAIAAGAVIASGWFLSSLDALD